MKKKMIWCALLCAVIVALCGSAFAADSQIEISKNYDGIVTVTPDTHEKSGDTVYTVQRSNVKAGDLYLVMIQSGTDAPTKDTLFYINMEAADSDTLTMTAYPDPERMKDGEYTVWLSDYSGSNNGKRAQVATVTLSGNSEEPEEPEYTLGDVDGKDGITSVDAMFAAQIAADPAAHTDAERAVADVNKQDGVTSVDAMLIAQKAANPSFDFATTWSEN